MCLNGKTTDLPDLAKNYLFSIHFYDKELGKWITELSIRAISIANEYVIEFDEFQDFYVSKFFDEHDGCFNCDVKIKFYDTTLSNVCYEKLYENQWLYVDPIDKLSTSSEEKLTRTARMESRKRGCW